MTYCCRHRSGLYWPLSEKLSPAANWNKYRDPQPDIKQIVRDLKTLSPDGMLPSNPSSQGSENAVEEEAKGM